MRSGSVATVLLLAFILVLPAFGKDSQPGIEEAQRKCAELAKLDSPGSPPFALLATFQFNNSEGKMPGQYLRQWLSPTRWRTDAILPGYHEVEIGGDGGLWRVKGSAARPEVVRKVVSVLAWCPSTERLTGLTFHSGKPQRLSGSDAICFDGKGKDRSPERLCFDQNTGVLLGERVEDEETVYSGYHSAGGKLVPSRAELKSRGQTVVTLDIAVKQPDADAAPYTPGPNFEFREQCDHPVFPKAIDSPEPESGGAQGMVVVGVTVDKTGHASRASILRHASDRLDAEALKAVGHWRFEPANCSGKPVEMDITVEFTFH